MDRKERNALVEKNIGLSCGAGRDYRNKLVEDNLGLIGFTVNKYFPGFKENDDIYQNCAVGLIKAADNYNPESGYSFSTYAVECMRRHAAKRLNRERVALGADYNVIYAAYKSLQEANSKDEGEAYAYSKFLEYARTKVPIETYRGLVSNLTNSQYFVDNDAVPFEIEDLTVDFMSNLVGEEFYKQMCRWVDEMNCKPKTKEIYKDYLTAVKDGKNTRGLQGRLAEKYNVSHTAISELIKNCNRRMVARRNWERVAG